MQLCIKGNIPEATAKGSYRKLIQTASHLKWETVSEREKSACVPSPDENDPMVTAARFSFELDKGCYATMMLRELMVTTMVRDRRIDP